MGRRKRREGLASWNVYPQSLTKPDKQAIPSYTVSHQEAETSQSHPHARITAPAAKMQPVKTYDALEYVPPVICNGGCKARKGLELNLSPSHV